MLWRLHLMCAQATSRKWQMMAHAASAGPLHGSADRNLAIDFIPCWASSSALGNPMLVGAPDSMNETSQVHPNQVSDLLVGERSASNVYVPSVIFHLVMYRRVGQQHLGAWLCPQMIVDQAHQGKLPTHPSLLYAVRLQLLTTPLPGSQCQI